MIQALSIPDLAALAVFITAWLGFDSVLHFALGRRTSLTDLMARERREWMLTMADRDLRMIDTGILNGLQQGAAFFGSATILAIGGCFAALGSTEQVIAIAADLGADARLTRALYEMKVFGLTLIFVYSFFKFGWSYRLFNYCGILMGAVPHLKDADEARRRKSAIRAADMNITASRHFTAGLRGIFFALAYLGWFLGPYVFIGTTVFVMIVLLRRQFFSRARAILAED